MPTNLHRTFVSLTSSQMLMTWRKFSDEDRARPDAGGDEEGAGHVPRAGAYQVQNKFHDDHARRPGSENRFRIIWQRRLNFKTMRNNMKAFVGSSPLGGAFFEKRFHWPHTDTVYLFNLPIALSCCSSPALALTPTRKFYPQFIILSMISELVCLSYRRIPIIFFCYPSLIILFLRHMKRDTKD